ncbi:MAG: Tat pathway signal sequence domain protein [Cyanobacteria bacterium RYN_339]|nr:Tat pathway signal sequence domain protein [Cyanobacteria bacterium RYN_339]
MELVSMAGTPVWVARIDLRDPAAVGVIWLAGQREALHPPVPAAGDAPFAAFLAAARPAVAVNGTFFSLAPGRPTMGTLVTAGILANHVAWRPVGITFGLGPGNRPELVPAGQASWRNHWLSLAGGPRLLTDGRITLEAGGIHDPAVLGVATRTAIGFDDAGKTLVVASIGAPVSLRREAEIMRSLGAWQALNLDGGTSRAIADPQVRVAGGRALTNVLAFYDARHPAPASLLAAFHSFRAVPAAPPPLAPGVDPGPFAAGRVTPYKVLTPRRRLDFEGWDFGPAGGAPAVRNVDGWLDLGKAGPTGVFAPWPRARRDYVVEALVQGSHGRLVVDAEVQAARFSGVALDWTVGRPPVLVRLAYGRTADRWEGRAGWSAGRHRVRLVARGASLEAWLDGRLAVAGRRLGPSRGIGFEGPLMVTRLVVGPPP